MAHLPPAPDRLRARAFDSRAAAPALAVTLLFTVAALLAPASATPPPDRALILGPLLYAAASLTGIALCLTLGRRTFGEAFLDRACPAPRALGLGLLYGLAALPPTLLLSHATSAALQALGHEHRPQEVFDWLNDGAVAPATRAFLIAAAILIAPVAEELLFRGVLFPALARRRSFAYAAFVTSLFFAFAHLHVPSVPPLLALGLAFSAGYAATGSILTPIAMHALFNAASLGLYFAGAV